MPLPSKTAACFLSVVVLIASGCTRQLPDWMQPGVREGAGRFQKVLYLKLDDIGVVTDIQFGELRAAGRTELGVAGNYGARFFDANRVLTEKTQFAVRQAEEFDVLANIVRRTSKSDLLFYRHAGAAATYDSLVGSDGKEIWRTPQHVAGAAFGTFSGQSAPEFFAVDQYGDKDGTVEARDVTGKLIWQREGLAPWNSAVGFLNAGPGGINLVLDGGENLIGLRADGQTVFQQKPVVQVSYFTTTTWPPLCPEQCLLTSGNEVFYLVTPHGEKVVTQLPAIHPGVIRATSVRFYQNAHPLLAVVSSLDYQGWKLAGLEAVHGALYIFDSDGHLVYHEVLPERSEAVGVLPSPDGKTDTLLVGGVDKVWQYTPIPPTR